MSFLKSILKGLQNEPQHDYATATNSHRIHQFFVTETGNRMTEAFVTETEISKPVLEY